MVEVLTCIFALWLSLFVIVDYYKYNTIYTPVFFLGAPFSFVLFIAVFAGPSVGFFPVSEFVVVIWFVGITLFWLPGWLLTFAVIDGKIMSPFVGVKGGDWIGTVVRLISYVFLCILFVSSIRSYMIHGTIGGEAFSYDFASQGIAAHCLSLMKYNVAYLVAARSNNKYQTILIAFLTFVFLFLYNVKGGIILTALVCLFARFIMSQSKLNIGKIIIIGFLGCIFFVLSYVIALGSFNFNFILFHFLAYLMAGTVGLSEHLRQGLPVDTDFALIVQPIVNIYHLITGGEVSSRISDFWVAINIVYAKKSNVKTFFGDIYIYSGVIKGILVTLVIGLASYFFLLLTIVRKKLTYLILYIFIISSLMLGWFNFYFNDLFYYEVVIYVFLITVIAETLSLIFGPRYQCNNECCVIKLNN